MIFDGNFSFCGTRQTIVVSKENGNEHILYNRSKCDVYQFHIDGGIVQDSKGERCDFIVEAAIMPRPNAFVIELKGSDLNKAISQILNTIQVYKENLIKHRILPRIIIHKVPTHDIHGKRYRDFKKMYPEAVVKVRQYSDEV